jgi:hypothetical protein
MPLPSILNGAKQCQVMTKRTKLRCKNPAAYGCKACRTHGAHKSRNVLRGKDHPRYRNGERTKDVETGCRDKSVMFRYLTDLGNYCDLFYKELKTRGRPPAGYEKLDFTDPEKLALAILKTAPRISHK